MDKKRIVNLTKTAAIFIFIMTFGISGFMYIEDFTFVDAMYTTIITFSTVGYEMPQHIGDAGKIFTSILIVLSFGAFGYYVTLLSKFIFEEIFTNFYKQRKMRKRIKSLENHVIICGYGRNGRQASIELSQHFQDFVIVDINEEVIDEISSETDNLFLQGDATHEDILIEAGIEKAKALITTMPSDANNVFVVLTARELNNDLKIISRASEYRADKKLKRAGATNVIMPDKIGGQRMAKLVAQPDIVEFLDYIMLQTAEEVSIIELSCNNISSCLENKSIKELGVRNKSGANIIGLKTSDGTYVFNPDPDYILSRDDKLFVLGSKTQIEKLRNVLNEKDEK